MNHGNAGKPDPGAHGPKPAEITDKDAYDQPGVQDDEDGVLIEFGKYGKMAASARIKGAGVKNNGVGKMRSNDDLRGIKKLHKPEHKPKRDV